MKHGTINIHLTLPIAIVKHRETIKLKKELTSAKAQKTQKAHVKVGDYFGNYIIKELLKNYSEKEQEIEERVGEVKAKLDEKKKS